jgi:hypothetical protein
LTHLELASGNKVCRNATLKPEEEGECLWWISMSI